FRAVVLAEGSEIGPAEFPQVGAPADRPEPMATTAAPLLLEAPAEPSPGSAADQRPSLSPGLPPEAGVGMLPILDAKGDIRPLAEVESELIRLAIAHYDGQMSEVARRLRIGRSTLYRRLKELGLESDELREFSAGGVAAE